MHIDLGMILKLSRRITEERFPVLARLAKVTEEVGEFAEATLVANNYMYKELKEPQVGELADVIITAVDTWLQSNPLYSAKEAETLLQFWLDEKFDKWQSKYPDLE